MIVNKEKNVKREKTQPQIHNMNMNLNYSHLKNMKPEEINSDNSMNNQAHEKMKSVKTILPVNAIKNTLLLQNSINNQCKISF